jgi:hypothetical protein
MLVVSTHPALVGKERIGHVNTVIKLRTKDLLKILCACPLHPKRSLANLMQVKAERATKPYAINVCMHNWLVLIPYASKSRKDNKTTCH